MRISRSQIEKMALAVEQSNGAEEFYLDVQSDGKLTFGAYEIIEKKKPIGLTNLKAEPVNAQAAIDKAHEEGASA